MRAKHLNEQQLNTAMQVLKLNRHDPWALCCELLIRSGMRSHELIKVTRKEINTERSTVFVHAAKNSKDRSVPIDFGCLLALEQALELKSMPWQCYPQESFKAALRRYWAKFRIQNLGVGLSHCSLHGLRASFAVRIYQQVGRDVLLVQELLGHKSIENTLKYVRLVQAEERKPAILKAFKTTKKRKKAA